MPSSERRKRIADAVTASMNSKRLTASMVCSTLKTEYAIDCAEKFIYNLRAGYISLPLDIAVPLARTIELSNEKSDSRVLDRYGYDPYLLIDLFGLTPKTEAQWKLEHLKGKWPESVDYMLLEKLRRLENVDHEIVKRQQQATSLGGATRVLLDAVLANREYSVAFWPVQAQLKLSTGDTVQIYAADRVDFLKFGEVTTSTKRVWDDLRNQLLTARAWPSIAEIGWPTEPSASKEASRWTIRHLDHPRQQREPGLLRGFPPIAVSATVSSSWAANLAGIISLVLGYGFTTTSDLARLYETTEASYSEEGSEACFTPTTRSREYLHNEMLRNPDNNEIWSHVSSGDKDFPNSPWKSNTGTLPAELIHIRLVETDELLKQTAKRRGQSATQVQKWKVFRDETALGIPNVDCLQLPVEFREEPEQMWEDLLMRATKILGFVQDHLERQFSANELSKAKKRLHQHQKKWAILDRDLTYPILEWLKDKDSPLVYPEESRQDHEADRRYRREYMD